MVTVGPPECLLLPLTVPHKLLMGPGPANVPPRVLAASALPLLGHLHPEFVKVMDEVKEGIRYAFQTTNRLTMAVSGTGHAAMEAAAVNLIEPRDVVLVTCAGNWGPRFADMADRQGAEVVKITKPVGEVFTVSELEEAVRTHRPAVMFVTHGESSSATCQPLEGIGAMCHRYSCLLVVDAVASLGGVPLYMDTWDIDMLYTGAQKVLSAPPGASPVSFSDRAWAKVQRRRSRVTSFYLDLEWLANYWGCDGQARRYHHTAPISSVYALREGLAMLAEEGLERSWERHRHCAALLYRGVDDLGLTLFVPDKAHRLPTVTAICVPDHISWSDVCQHAMSKYRVEISGGLGPTAGKIWRVGLMGYNATPENVALLLRVLKDALQACQGRKSRL